MGDLKGMGAILLLILWMGVLSAWGWGIILYIQASNTAGAIAAVFIPPIGVLHAVGLI